MVEIRIPDSFGGADHIVKVNHASSEQFASRLRKVARERRRFAKREGIYCYRIYDADLPEYAVAIDYYECVLTDQDAKDGVLKKRYDLYAPGAAVHIAEYQAPNSVDAELARQRMEDVLTLTPVVLGIASELVFAKVRKRDRGGSQYAIKRDPFVFVTQEGLLKIRVDLNGYLDTGIFPDHRSTREMLADMAKGKRFLNLFAYTGTATLHAADGKAYSTTTVDLSQTYLDWAKENMRLNAFVGQNHTFERGDTLSWLANAAKRQRTWDLIFVDPPTFSNSKAMGEVTWDVQRDHVALLKAAKRVLAKDGTIVFSNNLRTFKPDEKALNDAGLSIKDITPQTIPFDFERNPKIHKCYIVEAI